MEIMIFYTYFFSVQLTEATNQIWGLRKLQKLLKFKTEVNWDILLFSLPLSTNILVCFFNIL